MRQETDRSSVTASASRGALRAALEHPRFEVIPIKGVGVQVAYVPEASTVTITCSPRRGVEHTLRTASVLRRDGRVVPHIAARMIVDTAHLRNIMRQVDKLGLREIFVIAGDAREPAGEFADSLQLLRALSDIDHRVERIGVAAYPERHPLLDDATMWKALHEKQDLADYMVTQICFDSGRIGQWLVKARATGIHLPVYIGLPGAVDSRRLLRMSLQIGVGESIRYASRHTGIAARLLGRGTYHPDKLLLGLAPYLGIAAYNVAGLHLNTFNAVDATERWRTHMLRRTDG